MAPGHLTGVADDFLPVFFVCGRVTLNSGVENGKILMGER